MKLEVNKYWVVFFRFLRGFLAGGVSSVLVVINSGATISNLADLKQFGVSLGIAFLSGVLLAVDKFLRWE